VRLGPPPKQVNLPRNKQQNNGGGKGGGGEKREKRLPVGGPKLHIKITPNSCLALKKFNMCFASHFPMNGLIFQFFYQMEVANRIRQTFFPCPVSRGAPNFARKKRVTFSPFIRKCPLKYPWHSGPGGNPSAVGKNINPTFFWPPPIFAGSRPLENRPEDGSTQCGVSAAKQSLV